MIDPKIQKLIPEDFLEAVKNAYEEDDMYVVELNDGWEACDRELRDYETTIKVHKEPEDKFDTLEYRLGECTALRDAEFCYLSLGRHRVWKKGECRVQPFCQGCKLLIAEQGATSPHLYFYMIVNDGMAIYNTIR